MKALIILSLFISTTAFAAVEPGEATKQPLTFSMWKQQKIKVAHDRYKASLDRYNLQDSENVFQKREKQRAAERAYLVLQYSRKLTVNDYFEMYLVSNFPNNINALQYAIAGLNQGQIAELLAAYEKKLTKNQLKPFQAQ